MRTVQPGRSGWPDVVFTADDNSASWGSLSGTVDLAPLNKGTKNLVAVQLRWSGFASGSLGVCSVNGAVYCLRNDLAQNVLWYNKSLMDKCSTRSRPRGSSTRPLGDRRWPRSTPVHRRHGR